MKVGIALGSNLGDRLAYLRAGRNFLFTLHKGTNHPALSPVYETEPVDCDPGTPPFLNAVAEIETFLEPSPLLEHLQITERQMGRKDSPLRHRPRSLDLDILYMGTRQLHEGPILLPHPRAATRRFVLQPLADLHPEFILPGHTETVAQMLTRLPPHPDVRLLHRHW